MPTAKATFHSLLKDAQDYGSFGRDEKHMVSIIHFTLAVQGQVYPDMTVEVRQPYGTDYESEPLDVAQPVGTYTGPWNLMEFAEHCSRYYRNHLRGLRSVVQDTGRGDVRMRDRLLVSNVMVRFELPEFDSPGPGY
ncbi:MAG: hypothetical protein R6X07_02575 [Desulfatiglandales bacterium]